MSELMKTLRARGVDFRIVTGGEWDRHAWWADRVFRVPSVGFFLYRDYKVGWPAVPGLTRMLDAFEPELIHAANPAGFTACSTSRTPPPRSRRGRRAELERAAPYAHFAGLQVGESLARWYASADVLVFPSTTETFGNVVLEAFASRLPVVGVRRGGVAELVEDGVNGFLAAPQDPQDLADVVDRLLRDPLLRERLRTGAIRAAVERDWSQVNDALLASYDRLIRRTVPAADAAAVTSTHS
jgi:glycosyltransferase involved in cell wall biosynthesis